MAKGVFKKIIKGVLIGAGTVLSLFNPVVGAPLIVAGSAIKTSKTAEDGTASNDLLSNYATNLVTGLQAAENMSTAGNITFNSKNIMAWIQKNMLYIILGLAGLILIPKLLRTKRGRR